MSAVGSEGSSGWGEGNPTQPHFVDQGKFAQSNLDGKSSVLEVGGTNRNLKGTACIVQHPTVEEGTDDWVLGRGERSNDVGSSDGATVASISTDGETG